MLLVHNESISEALEAVVNEIEDVQRELDDAITKLEYAWKTEDAKDKDLFIKIAIEKVKEAQDKLHKK